MTPAGPGARPEKTRSPGSAPEANSRQAVLSTLTTALRAADGIDDPASRAAALAGISGFLHKAGDVRRAAKSISAALTVAGKIPDGSARGSALGGIARTRAAIDEPEAARAADLPGAADRPVDVLRAQGPGGRPQSMSGAGPS